MIVLFLLGIFCDLKVFFFGYMLIELLWKCFFVGIFIESKVVNKFYLLLYIIMCLEVGLKY